MPSADTAGRGAIEGKVHLGTDRRGDRSDGAAGPGVERIGLAQALLGEGPPQGGTSIADQDDSPGPAGGPVSGHRVEAAADEEANWGQEIF